MAGARPRRFPRSGAFAIDCYEHADQAGHAELCAWAADAMASIALYTERPAAALASAHKGLAHAERSHPLAVRLRAQAGRACARLGRRQECVELFAEARELHDALPARPPARFTVDTGVLADYAMTSYPASAYIWLGDHAEAKRHAIRAVEVHDAAPPESRSPSREAIARIDLALACAGLGSVDEALEHGTRALESPRVVESVRARAGQLDRALRRSYPDVPAVAAFHDQYRNLARS